jgi:biotin carboxyl carrier protein
MKAKHDVLAPRSGKVAAINVEIGSDVAAGQPILTLAA